MREELTHTILYKSWVSKIISNIKYTREKKEKNETQTKSTSLNSLKMSNSRENIEIW